MRYFGVVGMLMLSLATPLTANGQVITTPVENLGKANAQQPGSQVNLKDLTSDPDYLKEVSLSPELRDSSATQKNPQGFRAISVPEPGALALTGLALAWTIGSIRKARKQRAE
jgi:hypothetical protein